jgi:hypothetical protein
MGLAGQRKGGQQGTGARCMRSRNIYIGHARHRTTVARQDKNIFITRVDMAFASPSWDYGAAKTRLPLSSTQRRSK